jgi:hypothetical protein
MMNFVLRLVELLTVVFIRPKVLIPSGQNPYGTVSYQSDAFIVIENVTRNPVVPSQPNPELKQAHPYE